MNIFDFIRYPLLGFFMGFLLGDIIEIDPMECIESFFDLKETMIDQLTHHMIIR